MEAAEQKRLIISAKNGSMQAFEQLVSEYEKTVFNLALRLLKQEEDARDVSQEAFLKAWRGLDKFDGKAAFSTWLYRITYNCCMDWLRRQKGREPLSLDEAPPEGQSPQFYLPDSGPTPEEAALAKEEKTLLLSAINSLQEEYRQAIILRDLQGMSYAEIAELQQVEPGTVKSRIARGRSRLKEIILKNRELSGRVYRQKNKTPE